MVTTTDTATTGENDPAVDISLPRGLLIGGDLLTQSSGGTHGHIYPATGQVNATIPLAGATEIDQAVTAGWEAHREWMSFPPARRRELLFDVADAVRENLSQFAQLNTHDYAVPVSYAATAPLLEEFLRHFAGYVDKPHGASTPVSGSFDINLIEREPYGVVGVIAPWNGSLVVAAACVAPALAAGNAVVLKPSELAPFAAIRFGELCSEVGLPAGLVNVVPSGPDGGAALVRHPGIRKIHFTGGTATAREVLREAATNLTPVVAELGGKSADIVFDDADLDLATAISAHQGPLMQSGQSCACASRILVQSSVYDAFVEKFVATVGAANIGDPFDPAVSFGPVISESAADRILGEIDRAVSERAGELILGGNRVGSDRIGDRLAQGYYVEPTVFAAVDNASRLARTETFGPVVSVIRFETEADAVRIANDTSYGLNAFVHTTDLGRTHRVARQLEAGSVWVNHFSDISPQGPYGGYKQSGFGRTGGLEGLHEFLQVKNIRIAMR
ncbi:aldehyde dehydrogenase family protein [Rhodococcus sp. SJ-3]|uniref:aldehyde dehydrogenase family protein n=1 Tax=Rhodococcus sp. SJ-3 TaxID=3454628 RepID=UPI003F7AE5E8